MCVSSSGGAARAAQAQATQARQDQVDAQTQAAQATEDRKTQINTGMGNIDSAFSAFDDNYFSNLSKNYTDYAQPQLNDQYTEAQKQMAFNFARKGTLNSSMYGQNFAKLGQQYATNSDAVNSAGNAYANQERSTLEGNKQDAINQLNATGDAGAAGATAAARAKIFDTASRPSFSPLAPMFTNLTALAAQNTVNNQYGGGSSGLGAKLYGGSGSSYSVGG